MNDTELAEHRLTWAKHLEAQVKHLHTMLKDLADAARLDLEDDVVSHDFLKKKGVVVTDEVGCHCDSGDPSVGIPETTCTQHLAIYYYSEIQVSWLRPKEEEK